MRRIRYISLCSGYGAECLAMKRLKRDFPAQFDFELLAWAEIEPYACAAHDALHGDAEKNLGDITVVDWKQWHDSIGNPHVDLLFASTPCQSVSTAGKQAGMKKGTDAASALIWATEQCIATLLPDFIMYENVKGLISKRNMPDFMEFCATVEKYGYKYMYQVLNAKDYGVPQNRERVFPIFYRDPDWQFEYPKPFPLKKRLRDVLEDNVDESYYLKPEQVERILAHCERKQAEGCGFKPNFQDVRAIDQSEPLRLEFTDRHDQKDMTYISDAYTLRISRPCTLHEFVKAFIESAPSWDNGYGAFITRHQSDDIAFDKELDETYADFAIFDKECKAVNGYGWHIFDLHLEPISGGVCGTITGNYSQRETDTFLKVNENANPD